MYDSDRAQALADRVWEELLEREPTFATAIGDERYDDRLPDIGEPGRATSETQNRAALDELATIDRGSLDITLRTTMDVLEAIAIQALAAVEHRTDRLYVVNHFVGPGVLLGPGTRGQEIVRGQLGQAVAILAPLAALVQDPARARRRRGARSGGRLLGHGAARPAELRQLLAE